MESLVTLLTGEALFVAIGHHIELTPYDRLHFRGAVLVLQLARFSHEFEHAEHVAMVRDGQRGLPVRCGFLVKCRDAGRPVEQRELGVNVEMRELHGRRATKLPEQDGMINNSFPHEPGS